MEVINVRKGGPRERLQAGRLAPRYRFSSLHDALPKPRLYFGFDPADCTGTNPHSARKSSFCLELVNHRAPEPGCSADIRQAEDLDCALTFDGQASMQGAVT